jgi:two-component system, sensor histidine kinase and response regulator
MQNNTHEGESARGLILLVEDNDVNQRVASRILQRAGYRVSVAVNGQEALKMLADEQPSLILMDLHMPVMDGFEATAKIRRGASDIPIVALTANAMKGDREKCLAAGMVGYVSKPIDKKALLQEIERALA